MKWEYKRITRKNAFLERTDTGFRDPRHEPSIEDFEKTLNELGQDGWELASSAVVDGYQSDMFYKTFCVIEYIFKRPVK